MGYTNTKIASDCDFLIPETNVLKWNSFDGNTFELTFMDLMPHAMLAEIGAQTNTIEEARNAMEPFAAMLAKVLLEQ